MEITINATVAADYLAIGDVYHYFDVAYPGNWSREDIKNFVHLGKSLPSVKGAINKGTKSAPVPEFVNSFYQKKHDYYFEILINIKL